jgi:hypothetical protein
MRTAALHIRGDFEDAYLYMGWLVVVTAERSFRFYGLDEIVSEIRNMLPDSTYVAELMFRHNEWLTSAQFDSLTKTSSLARDVITQFDLFPHPCFEVPREVSFKEYDIRVGTSVVLDYFIYNRHVYVGGKDGLFSAFVDWDSDVPVLTEQFRRRLDARCMNVTGRFGAVVASCGDDGLLWAAESPYGLDEPQGTQWERAENTSIRARWLASGIVNYKTATDPDLLGIRKARSVSGGSRMTVRSWSLRLVTTASHFRSVFCPRSGVTPQVCSMQVSFNTFSIPTRWYLSSLLTGISSRST